MTVRSRRMDDMRRRGRPGPGALVGLGLACAIAILPITGGAGAAERVLTLDEAIEMALGDNEEIRISRESLEAARASVSGAQGAYDPLLDLEAGWRESKEPVNSIFSGGPGGDAATLKTTEGFVSVRQLLPTGGSLAIQGSAARDKTDGTATLLSPAYDTRVDLELRQPLLRGLTIDAARRDIRATKSLREEASANLERTISETVAAVENAYWRLVASRRAVQVLEEALALAERQLAETNTRVESGTAPETETAQPRAEIERRRGDLLAAREDVARAENALKLLILDGAEDAGWPDRIVPTMDVSVAVVPVDVAAEMSLALEKRPEVQAAEAAVARRRAEASFARNATWPALDAVVSYGRFGLTGTRNPVLEDGELPPVLRGNLGDSFEMIGDGDFDATRFALAFGIPIGNRTARAAARSAGSAERQAEADLSRARKLIRAQVLDAAAALETAGQRIEAARAGREAAEVQLGAEQDRYAAGLSTNFLVLTRQNDLSRARLEEIAAQTDYRTAMTEMARATGTIMQERMTDAGKNRP